MGTPTARYGLKVAATAVQPCLNRTLGMTRACSVGACSELLCFKLCEAKAELAQSKDTASGLVEWPHGVQTQVSFEEFVEFLDEADLADELDSRDQHSHELDSRDQHTHVEPEPLSEDVHLAGAAAEAEDEEEEGTRPTAHAQASASCLLL